MHNEIKIETVSSLEVIKPELTELLVQVVEGGASIGFLPPISVEESETYWSSVLGPGVVLLIANLDHRVAGAVQLHLSMKPNGARRAEIAKLMTHPAYRRRGIGRSLMEAAEARARVEGRNLIVLDTREGDLSNLLYESLGYIQAGRIPNYALSANGEPHATIYYYKELLP